MKKKDNDTYVKLGMMYQCASYFNIDIDSECVLNIVNTYLQHINDCTFLEWIRGCHPSEKVVVMNKAYLKEFFNDLLTFSDDLNVLSNLFMNLYGQAITVDEREKVLYTTTFNLSLKKRKSLKEIMFDDICNLYKEKGYLEGYFEANEYGREEGIAEVLTNVFNTAKRYGFKYEYKESEWDKMDNTHDTESFSENDFYNINIKEDNYCKADAITTDFMNELIKFLKIQLRR